MNFPDFLWNSEKILCFRVEDAFFLFFRAHRTNDLTRKLGLKMQSRNRAKMNWTESRSSASSSVTIQIMHREPVRSWRPADPVPKHRHRTSAKSCEHLKNLRSERCRSWNPKWGGKAWTPLRNTTKKCANVERVSRNDEKLLNTSTLQKRGNKRPGAVQKCVDLVDLVKGFPCPLLLNPFCEQDPYSNGY